MATRIPRFIMYSGDTAPNLLFTIKKKDGTGAQNLSGVVVKCLLRIQGGSTNVFTGSQTTCTVTSVVNGQVTYVFPAAISDPGIYTGQLYLDFGAGVVQRTERFELQVLDGIPAT